MNKVAPNILKKQLPAIIIIIAYTLMMKEDTSRMYWPFMIATYIIGAAVYYYHKRKQDIALGNSVTSYLFPKKMWLHQSSINDCTLFIFNYIIYFHFIAFYLNIEPYFLYEWLTSFLETLNVPRQDAEPGIMAGIAFTICTLLLTELTYYITHRAYHEIPFLWELHKVHHSAEVMTPLTFIRAHPIDLIIQNFMKLTGILVSSAIFIYLYPNIEGMIMVGAIDAGLFVYYVAGANLHHSHIWLSFGRKLEHVFISPAQHQIHHSTNPKHFDKNYGSMLSIWDWAFGSLYIPEKNETVEFGLSEKEQKNYSSTKKLLYYPLEQMLLILAKKLFKKNTDPKAKPPPS